MRLFDFNVALGRFARPGLGCFDTTADLTGEMQSKGISDALVYHALAADADADRGNRLLLDKLGNAGHLHACWVATPPYLGDISGIDRWIRMARDGNVRAIRMFPQIHGYSLAESTMQPILTALAEARFPVLFDFAGQDSTEPTIRWRDVVYIAQRFPSLQIVLIAPGMGAVRDVDAILRTTSNVYIECSGLTNSDVYELFAKSNRTDRVLFGTSLPRRAAECSVHQFATAGLKKAEQLAIGGSNARKLLGLTDNTSAGASFQAAETLDVPIIDVHGYCGAWDRMATGVKGSDTLVRSMDRCGVGKLVVSSFCAIHGETRLGNSETAICVRRHPERLYGYCVVNPNYPRESEGELRFCFEDSAEFVGILLHCRMHGAELHDDSYRVALEFADTNHLPVMVHGTGNDRWNDICATYPGANFIMANASEWDGSQSAGRRVFDMAASIPNLYADLSGAHAHRGALRALVTVLGTDKVLYGSSFPIHDFGFELGRVLRCDMTSEDKRALCSANARQIFRTL